jgi:hypothetical protein
MFREIDTVFTILKKDIIQCHYYWNIHNQLFENGGTRVEIINKTVPSFFIFLKYLLEDYMTLELSRITDQVEKGKNMNLSFYYLFDLIKNESNVELQQRLLKILEELSSTTKQLRSLRNKTIAHRDLDFSIKDEGYIFPSNEVESALTIINNFMNEIELKLYNKTTYYHNLVTQLHNDGQALIIELAKSVAYAELVKQQLVPPDLWKNYL